MGGKGYVPMPPVLHNTTPSNAGQPRPIVVGQVGWDTFRTVDRQKAAMVWVNEILKLIVERNGRFAIIHALDLVIGTLKPPAYPDKTGDIKVMDLVKSMPMPTDYNGSDERQLAESMNLLHTVWMTNREDDIRRLVYRVRNTAPSWQVNKDELEALAAALLT